MNKPQLIAAIADRARLDKKDAAAMLDALIATVTETVARGEDVTLVGFGKWEQGEQAAREGVSTLTGRPYSTPAKRVPRFKAGAEFKTAVAEGGKQTVAA